MKKAFTCTTLLQHGKCIKCKTPVDLPRTSMRPVNKLCQLCIDKRNISLVKYNK